MTVTNRRIRAGIHARSAAGEDARRVLCRREPDLPGVRNPGVHLVRRSVGVLAVVIVRRTVGRLAANLATGSAPTVDLSAESALRQQPGAVLVAGRCGWARQQVDLVGSEQAGTPLNRRQASCPESGL
jgi:hypothetical protein